MSIKTMANKVTSKVGRQVLTAQKHSPTIMFGVGIVGVVSTAVLASCATMKMDSVLKDVEEDKKKIDQAENLAKDSSVIEYTEQDAQKDKALVRVKIAMKVLKLYAPAIGVGALSVACLTGSHIILNRRNVALTAAYAALDKGFKEYRGRVVEELGNEKDAQFRYGMVDKEIVEEGEHGPETKVVKVMPTDRKHSIYARCFDKTNSNWQPNPMHNQMFIQCQQNYMNDKLRANGHVFLNEVYDALGMERTPAGQAVGWIRGGDGDDYISFGVFDGDMIMGENFVNGNEKSVWLDFNVDGVVYDKI